MNILESRNYHLSKSEEDYIIKDINLLLKQYETLLKSNDDKLNSKKILDGSVICEYMLNLGLKKDGFQFKNNAQLEQIIEFCKAEKIIPKECINFLEIIKIYRNITINDLDTPKELTSSFLNAFIYYITWFNNYYSKDKSLFNIKDCFNIIDENSDTKLFSLDNTLTKEKYVHTESSQISNKKSIYCPKCGGKIYSYDKFCQHCGKKLSKKERISEKIKKHVSNIEVENQSFEKNNNSYADKLQTELILQMLGAQNEALEEILKTVIETLNIAKNIDAKLDLISKNLNRIQSQSEKLLKAAWSEEEIDMIIQVHTTECVENILEYKKEITSDNQFKQEEIKLIDSFSQDTWSKLSSDSKTFLITSKFMYNKLLTLDGVEDYSGICVLITKALEVEIFKRFFTNFIKYLDEKYNKDYSKYHTALLFQYKEPLREERFTMGNIAFILCKKENKYDNENQKQNNRKKLLEYCRECVFSNYTTAEIEKLLDRYASSIEYIRVEYRNPSAHRNHIRRVTAQKCFELIVDVHKLLKEMIDSFDE